MKIEITSNDYLFFCQLLMMTHLNCTLSVFAEDGVHRQFINESLFVGNDSIYQNSICLSFLKRLFDLLMSTYFPFYPYQLIHTHTTVHP